MPDVIFVAVVVAFFALSVAYVRACERIVGRDTGAETLVDAAGDDVASSLEPSIHAARPAAPGSAR